MFHFQVRINTGKNTTLKFSEKKEEAKRKRKNSNGNGHGHATPELPNIKTPADIYRYVICGIGMWAFHLAELLFSFLFTYSMKASLLFPEKIQLELNLLLMNESSWLLHGCNAFVSMKHFLAWFFFSAISLFTFLGLLKVTPFCQYISSAWSNLAVCYVLSSIPCHFLLFLFSDVTDQVCHFFTPLIPPNRCCFLFLPSSIFWLYCGSVCIVFLVFFLPNFSPLLALFSKEKVLSSQISALRELYK